MKYLIAYIPYTRLPENIDIVFFENEKELLQFIVEYIRCAPVQYEDGVFYDYDGYEVDFSLRSCLSYLESNFVGDGSYGATLLTITKGKNVLFQG
jgi:hypothetical protein